MSGVAVEVLGRTELEIRVAVSGWSVRSERLVSMRAGVLVWVLVWVLSGVPVWMLVWAPAAMPARKRTQPGRRSFMGIGRPGLWDDAGFAFWTWMWILEARILIWDFIWDFELSSDLDSDVGILL